MILDHAGYVRFIQEQVGFRYNPRSVWYFQRQNPFPDYCIRLVFFARGFCRSRTNVNAFATDNSAPICQDAHFSHPPLCNDHINYSFYGPLTRARHDVQGRIAQGRSSAGQRATLTALECSCFYLINPFS